MEEVATWVEKVEVTWSTVSRPEATGEEAIHRDVTYTPKESDDQRP